MMSDTLGVNWLFILSIQFSNVLTARFAFVFFANIRICLNMYSKYRARVFAWLVKQSKCRCVLFVKAFLYKREGVLVITKRDIRCVYVYFIKSIKVKNILLQLFF